MHKLAFEFGIIDIGEVRRLPEVARRRWVHYINKWRVEQSPKKPSTKIGGGW